MDKKKCMDIISMRGYKIRSFTVEPTGHYRVDVELVSPHFNILKIKATSLYSLLRDLPESPFPNGA